MIKNKIIFEKIVLRNNIKIVKTTPANKITI